MEFDGDLKVVDREIPVIWPWEFLSWLDTTDQLRSWIADKPEDANARCAETCFSANKLLKYIYIYIYISKSCSRSICNSQQFFFTGVCGV